MNESERLAGLSDEEIIDEVGMSNAGENLIAEITARAITAVVPAVADGVVQGMLQRLREHVIPGEMAPSVLPMLSKAPFYQWVYTVPMVNGDAIVLEMNVVPVDKLNIRLSHPSGGAIWEGVLRSAPP